MRPAGLPADAERFRAAHQGAATGAGPLVLPNAWDAASAAALVEAGFDAIATSSGAVSRSLGYADGEGTPAAEMFAAIARIVAGATTAAGPERRAMVSADVEAGYGLGPDELVERLLDCGVVGLNLEDSAPRTAAMLPVEEQSERIAAVVDAARRAGVRLVINARVDLHVRQDGPTETRLERSLARARAYIAAGADCVFPIMLTGEADIDAYVKGAPGPVNVMVRPTAPDLSTLADLGVARVTFGSGLHRVALTALTHAAATIRAGVSY